MSILTKLSIAEFKNLIPNYIWEIAKSLGDNGFEAYLVGGSIRDLLLGKIPDDFDVATNAHPEEIIKIFPKSIPTGASFGTITVVAKDQNGEHFDAEVTTYRSEADYVGGRWPSKVEFTKTIEEDLSRRDFSINAIAFNLLGSHDQDNSVSEYLVDLYNGIEDMQKKIIRAVRDPFERFSEDGLRSVRACRLASQLDFEIEPKTFEAITQTLHITKLVAIERFQTELLKLILKSPKPSKGLILMKDSGILELFIPELLEGIGVNQPQFHVDDVFTHSVKACDEAEDSIKLAALFHDIAKPRTKSEDAKGVHFYGHDVKGAEMTKEIMKRLRFPTAEIERVSRLVRWHMFYYPSADWRRAATSDDHSSLEEVMAAETDGQVSHRHGWTDGAIRRFIKNVGGEDAVDELMKLRIADAAANPKTEFNPKELDELSRRIAEVRSQEMALKITDLDITGTDLMQNLQIKPGKQLGEILNHLLEIVLDEPLLNKKLDLLRLAKKYIEKESEVAK